MRWNKRKIILMCALAVGLPGTYVFGDLLLTAKAIAAPNASGIQVLKLALHPPFEMAAPHLSQLQKFSFNLVPDASACTVGCTGYESKATCQALCRFCGHCPDCVNGPCTIYMCTYTGANRACQNAFNSNKPCSTCANDATVSRSSKCSGPAPCAAPVK